MDGAPFLQVKALKNGKVIVNAVFVEGVVVLQCRECFRYHRIKVNSVLRDEHPMMDVR